MNFEINSKIEDIQATIGAWYELEQMRERCQNPEALDKAQAGLDKLIITLLMDVVELYNAKTAESGGEYIFENKFNACEDIIGTVVQIFFSRNGFLGLQMIEENEKFTERLEKINSEINALLITTAEELVKEYVKVSANE